MMPTRTEKQSQPIEHANTHLKCFGNNHKTKQTKIKRMQTQFAISVILSIHIMIAQAFIEPSNIGGSTHKEMNAKIHRSTTTGFLRAIPKRIEIPVFRKSRQHLSCPALHSHVLDIPLDKSTHSEASIETVSSTASWLIEDEVGEDSMIESEVGIDSPTLDGQQRKNPNSLMSTLVSHSELQ